MQKRKLYFGIDGGGTKCKAIIVDEHNTLLGEGFGGAANIRMSVEKSWLAVMTAVEQALFTADLQLDDPAIEYYAAFGLAGCECLSAFHEFLKFPHPFSGIILVSDVYAACVGAHNGADGSIIIIGTGSIGLRVEDNQHIKVGGWGFPHSDEGGGAWLGLAVIRLLFKQIDQRIASSALLEAVYAHFHCDPITLTEWANQANSTEFATIAPFCVEYAAKEDPWALDCLKRAAGYIDNLAANLSEKAPSRRVLPICLFGGLAPYIQPYLSKHITDHLQTRQHDATYGAIMILRQRLKNGQSNNDESKIW